MRTCSMLIFRGVSFSTEKPSSNKTNQNFRSLNEFDQLIIAQVTSMNLGKTAGA